MDQVVARDNLWNLLDDNGNGLLSLAEAKAGVYEFFKENQALKDLEKKFKLITKAFNLAKNWLPATTKAQKKRGKKSVNDKYIEIDEFRIFLIALRQRYEYF